MPPDGTLSADERKRVEKQSTFCGDHGASAYLLCDEKTGSIKQRTSRKNGEVFIMQNYEEGEIPLISENEAAKGAETPVNQPKTFSHAYFKEAAKVFKDARKLAFAAVICALRVAVKSLSLQIAPGVYLSFDCYVNALGSLVYGPLMALCVGAVSDTIGGVMFPKGAYFSRLSSWK